MRRSPIGGAIVVALLAAGCEPKPKPKPGVAVDAGPAIAVGTADVPDREHGRTLVKEYQCNRCHSGTGTEAPPANKDCVGCHANIVAGTFATCSRRAISAPRFIPRCRASS